MLMYLGMPSPINDLTIKDGETCNLLVSWTPSSGDPVCGPISSNVTILPSDEVMIMNISDTYYNITGLTPNTSYNISATSSNMAGAVESMEVHVTNFSNSVPSGE